MMANLTPIEITFNLLKEKQGDASFEEIWNTISKEINGENVNKNQIIAELYTDLVLDNRFALTADGKWGLRDYLKFEDVKKQYDYIDKFETTEEFDDIDSYVHTDIFDEGDTLKKGVKDNIIHDTTDTSNDLFLDLDDDDDDEDYDD